MIIGLILGLVLAQLAPPPVGPSEVLGFALGSEFSVSQCGYEMLGGFAARPAGKNKTYFPSYNQPLKPCFKHRWGGPAAGEPVDDQAEVLELVLDDVPSGFDKEGILAHVIEGRLEVLSLRTFGAQLQGDVLERLTEKFGKPLVVDSSDIQNRMGATFSKVVAMWRFSNMEVVFSGIASNIDQGVVVINTPAGKAYLDSESAEARSREPKL